MDHLGSTPYTKHAVQNHCPTAMHPLASELSALRLAAHLLLHLELLLELLDLLQGVLHERLVLLFVAVELLLAGGGESGQWRRVLLHQIGLVRLPRGRRLLQARQRRLGEVVGLRLPERQQLTGTDAVSTQDALRSAHRTRSGQHTGHAPVSAQDDEGFVREATNAAAMPESHHT